HELVELSLQRDAVRNLCVAVSEWGERIIFLRRLQEGGASRSYGLQCARLAGMPEDVVGRAKELLSELELHGAVGKGPQLSLFAPPEPASEETTDVPDGLRQMLEGVQPDEMSPRQAHELLYRLIEKVDR
ncbi:MAG: DNA mismatch repair protein MutS, partial [Myxococcota bacterium]|nr:DNA mismatch repair protein MutS [Myxococcota bacterium]